jgi:hypothetical protein
MGGSATLSEEYNSVSFQCRFLKLLILNYTILLHCVDLTLCPTIFHLCAKSINSPSSSYLYCHYTFRPNLPSSGVKVVVLKESTAHCNAVLLFLCNFLGEKTTPRTSIRCNGNVFMKLLPNKDRGIHRHTRPTIFLSLCELFNRVNVFTEPLPSNERGYIYFTEPLSSNVRNDIQSDTQTDGRDL